MESTFSSAGRVFDGEFVRVNRNCGGSFLSGVVFGYVAKIFDSYDLPLILTAFVLGFGALMWLKIDPTQELIPEDHPLLAKA